MGIDTPESRTSDDVEKLFGLAAKNRLYELMEKYAKLITTENKDGEDMKGKFGRVLGDFIIDGKQVSQIMCKEGHAVAYFGGAKADVRRQHMKNRKKLVEQGVVKGARE